MTTIQGTVLHCPMCTQRLETQPVASPTFQGQRTDFHKPAKGEQYLIYQVHMCTWCGFASNHPSDFHYDDDLGDMELIRDRLENLVKPLLESADTFSGSLKYEAAARTAHIIGRGAERIADLYLKAAYCCVDEGDYEAERYYQKQAAAWYGSALTTHELVNLDDRARLTYLVGELWRRIGDEDNAHTWFDMVKDEIFDLPKQGWILALAIRQRDKPDEWLPGV